MCLTLDDEIAQAVRHALLVDGFEHIHAVRQAPDVDLRSVDRRADHPSLHVAKLQNLSVERQSRYVEGLAVGRQQDGGGVLHEGGSALIDGRTLVAIAVEGGHGIVQRRAAGSAGNGERRRSPAGSNEVGRVVDIDRLLRRGIYIL